MLVIDISVLDLSLYAAGMAWYNRTAKKEDRATLGSDPSAFLVPYGMRRYLTVPPIFTTTAAYAGGLHAINPSPVTIQK